MTDTGRLSTALADRYQIVRHLGQGGMATVYLARDIKHQRNVALKVLRPELAAVIGAERFLKEIEVTANLQHPNILPLYDSGHADTFLYYVMPYVEGESLRDRITREKQLGVEDAVAIAKSVAAALDYAHRHGVIHRDIKPENVLLHDGQALVADFGIALALTHAGGTRMTETGLSLGTPHYMSPEQATGDRTLDARSDVYALGAVTYEMLTGDPPHTGNTVQAIVAKVLSATPVPITQVRSLVPPNVDAAVQRALAKAPADRFATAAELSAALTNPGFTLPTMTATMRGAGPPRSVALRALPWIVAATAVAAAGWGWLRHAPSSLPYQLGVTLADSQAVSTEHFGTSLALSPDGSQLVYVGRGTQGHSRLYVRALADLDPHPIAGTDNAESPFFSPNGQWVAFFADRKLKKVSIAGGVPLSIAEASNPRGGTWTESDVIVFAPNSVSPLLTVSPDGQRLDTLTTVRPDSGETSHRFPDALPGGAVAFLIQTGATYRLGVVTLDDKKVRVVAERVMGVRWSPTGHLLYANEAGGLFAQLFNPRRLSVSGDAVQIADAVMTKPRSGGAELTVSRSGTLAYVSGVTAPGTLVSVDRRGTQHALTEVSGLSSPAVAPNGRDIALLSIAQGHLDVRVYDTERGTLRRLTTEGSNVNPDWTPHGDRVSFASSLPGQGQYALYWAAADGSEPPSLLFRDPQGSYETAWAPDGKSAAIRRNGTTSMDIAVLMLDSARTVRPYLNTGFNEKEPSMSRDGRWLAYVSDVSGSDEVYVRAYPTPGAVSQVSVNGGIEPRWARNGREVFYRKGDSLVAVNVTIGATFAAGARSVLFVRPYLFGPNHVNYDVLPDGEHFVFVKGGTERSNIVVPLNWTDALKRKAAK